MVKKWMGPAVKRPGALHRHFGIPEDREIPVERIRAEYNRLRKKAEGEKKLTKGELTLFRQLQYAITARKIAK